MSRGFFINQLPFWLINNKRLMDQDISSWHEPCFQLAASHAGVMGCFSERWAWTILIMQPARAPQKFRPISRKIRK